MPLSRTLNHLFLKASSSVFSKANSRSLSASVWGHSAKVMLIVELYHHDSERMLERLVQRLVGDGIEKRKSRTRKWRGAFENL